MRSTEFFNGENYLFEVNFLYEAIDNVILSYKGKQYSVGRIIDNFYEPNTNISNLEYPRVSQKRKIFLTHIK
jgi:hypothetical protein